MGRLEVLKLLEEPDLVEIGDRLMEYMEERGTVSLRIEAEGDGSKGKPEVEIGLEDDFRI